MYRWHIQPGIYRIRDATVGEELISGHFQGNSVVEVRADGNCVTFYRVTPIVHAEVSPSMKLLPSFSRIPQRMLVPGMLAARQKSSPSWNWITSDISCVTRSIRVMPGKVGRCVNGVGVGDTVEIWFFGGLSVGYRNLAERLKLSCPLQEHFYP